MLALKTKLCLSESEKYETLIEEMYDHLKPK